MSRPLLLIPTEMERGRLPIPAAPAFDVELIGLGPAAAAARTGALITRMAPSRALLLGIAGTFREDAYAVGSATTFGSVVIDGIGAGDGDAFRSAPEIGYPYWPGDADTPRVDDRLPLDAADGAPALLTVCASAGSPDVAERRRGRYPDVVAEDMEAWGVAFACTLADVPLTVVRGASNVAGDRDHAGWRIDEALAAAWALASPLLEPSR